MYDPDHFNDNYPLLCDAHDRNDEILERIYIGRRFKNDTERLEKLFALYAQEQKHSVLVTDACLDTRTH